MKAYLYTEAGARIADAPDPAPGPEQVLVKVRAACFNRADLGMIAGRSHGARGGVGSVLGNEWAGEVLAIGDAVSGIAPGDRVMGSGGGGFAELTAPDMGRVLPIPHGMSFEQAAALPVALTTMHNALVTNGGLAPGQAVMIQGASSGVGLMGLKIAKRLGAKFVVGSSTDHGRRGRLADFGADLAVNSSEPGWVAQVLEATGGKGVDLIVDNVSGKTVNQSLAATRLEGRIVNVGRLGGAVEKFDFDLHALRRIHYIGVTFRTRTVQEIRDVFAAMRKDLWPAIEARQLDLPVDKVFAFRDITKAAAHMAANQHFGKIVVTL